MLRPFPAYPQWRRPQGPRVRQEPRPVEPIRFVDVLTTAAAVANYVGESTVGPRHLLRAVAILRDEESFEDLGRPVSPLVPRPAGGADPRVRDLAQRWFAALGSDVHATLAGDELARFLDEVRSLSES